MKKTIKNIKEIIRKLKYILTAQQKRKSVVVFFFTVIGSLLEMFGVSMMIPLITAMLYPEKLLENRYVSMTMTLFHLDGAYSIAILVGILVIVVYVAKNAYLIFLSYVRSKFSCQVQRELSIKMMSVFMEQEYSFFLNTNSSELLRGISEDVSRVHNVLNYIFRLIAEGLTVAAIAVFIFKTDYIMASCVILMVGTCLVLVSLFFRKRMKRMGKERVRCETMLKQDAYQAFQGIKEIMVMNRQEYFVKKYEDGWKRQQRTMINETVASESPAYIIEGMSVIGLIAAVCIRIGMGVDTDLFLTQLAAFAVGAFRVLPAASRITSTINLMNYYLPGIDSVYSNLKSVEMHAEREWSAAADGGKSKNFDDRIDIEHVSYRYENADREVLCDLSLSIERGMAVGLIGASGAGKTTLADIILGLLKPESGKLQMDGVDIAQMGERWHELIGYVPQSVYLVDDSIRKNVAFGVWENEIDDDAVWKALEQAQLKDFVEGLPDGLDTMVGERGVRFSGGQRQRIAIARALYTDPQILVLDEATSALDNETEEAVMEAIDQLQGRKTLIIVAHRLTTIEKCDVVYEVANGKAVVKRGKGHA